MADGDIHAPPLVSGSELNEFEVFVRHMIATVVPYGIVFGSVLLKLPQIMKILQQRSADGISMSSLGIELISCVITASWGISQSLMFKDYGESVLIMIEMFLLVILAGCLQRKFVLTVALFTVAASALGFMSIGRLPRDVHEQLLRLQVLFAFSSRVPQITMNFRNKSTGQLSALTFFLAVAGATSRLLTTFHNVPLDKGRDIMLAQFVVVIFLNLIIVAQCIMYGAGAQRHAPVGHVKSNVKKNK
uniref:Mannose-P-dolichol utilization defect 1 protein homolog n=1 Tax=Trypanosoma congolense (strain IL3000) TaxID=1068625 RepID=G0UQ37_TRYCI|nr:conserved hypothetical protein [Trypanosoma congolense IL3000]